MFKIRVISPWLKELQVGDNLFSASLPADEADALLCDWAPSDELFTFPRRKAWYCCEPEWQFRGLFGGEGRRIRSRLKPSEVLYHSHPDRRFRVPITTHIAELSVNRCEERLDKAVAVVSNFGGSPRRRHPDLQMRNNFATHPSVDLYGRRSWSKYRAGLFSFPRLPKNYRGELPGDWEEEQKRKTLARYKVSVCLENICEPHWFTEKMVESVCAGCVPIYHAHPSLLDNVLDGARWVDPADYGWEIITVLEAALNCNAKSYRDENAEWLRTNRSLAATHYLAIYSRIAECIRQQD